MLQTLRMSRAQADMARAANALAGSRTGSMGDPHRAGTWPGAS